MERNGKRKLVYYFDTETMLIVRKRAFLLVNNSWSPIYKGDFNYKNHNGLYVPESLSSVYLETNGNQEIVTRHSELSYDWKDLDNKRMKWWKTVDLQKLENLERLVNGEDIAEVATGTATTR